MPDTERKQNEKKAAEFDRAQEVFLKLAIRSGGTRHRTENEPDQNHAEIITEVGQVEVYGKKNLNELREAVNALDALFIKPISGKKAVMGGQINKVWEDAHGNE